MYTHKVGNVWDLLKRLELVHLTHGVGNLWLHPVDVVARNHRVILLLIHTVVVINLLYAIAAIDLLS